MIEREFEVGDTPAVQVAIRSGGVQVERGDPGKVRVVADTNSKDFILEQLGGRVVARAPRGERTSVTVVTPSGTDLEVSTASGDVHARVDLGKFEVSTASGDVYLEKAVTLVAKSASGSVRGDTVTTEARCVTASGDIRISRLPDRASLSTASGDVVVDEASGNLTCATVSGDVRVDSMIGPSFEGKSMSGNTRIGIPGRTRVDLDVNTLSGKIRLPTPSENPQPPEREMTIRARTVSGNIRIDRID
ncbi:MAG: DUF4097 family beta strand repeat-containing protein [Acidimicrobiia bacterium]